MSKGKIYEKRSVFYQTITLLKITLLTKLQDFGESYSFDPFSLWSNSEPNMGTRIVVISRVNFKYKVFAFISVDI